jgi:hypothetical protein
VSAEIRGNGRVNTAIGRARVPRSPEYRRDRAQRLWDLGAGSGDERYRTDCPGSMVARGDASNLWSRITG